MHCHRLFHKSIFLGLLLVILSACGESGTDPSSPDASAMDTNCPPAPKSGLSGIQRAGGMDSFEKYSKWQIALPPKSCAGELASYIPDLPDGYGLPPSVRPPIVTPGHVYLKYVEIPPLTGDQALEMISFGNQPQFEFEIVKLTNEEATKFRDWFKENKASYREYPIEDRMFYALGGGGWYMPGNKLSGGIGTILDNNVLIKFTMPKIYADDSVAKPVAKMFHKIAQDNGH